MDRDIKRLKREEREAFQNEVLKGSENTVKNLQLARDTEVYDLFLLRDVSFKLFGYRVKDGLKVAAMLSIYSPDLNKQIDFRLTPYNGGFRCSAYFALNLDWQPKNSHRCKSWVYKCVKTEMGLFITVSNKTTVYKINIYKAVTNCMSKKEAAEIKKNPQGHCLTCMNIARYEDLLSDFLEVQQANYDNRNEIRFKDRLRKRKQRKNAKKPK